MSLKADLSHLPTPARTKESGWAPDAEPRFIQALAERWHADNEAAGPKPRAVPTSRFRHSDAGKCARAIAFAALDLPPSNPMDLSGTWATSLGTLVHELWQEVIAELHPDAEIEPKVSSIDGLGSGHIDAVFPGGKKVAFELKTVGGFAYKMAVGERGNAQGPKTDHLLQASLNGVAVDADEVVIGYLAKEALSVNVAARKGFGEIARFAAEWTMQRDQFEPIAAAEAARVKGILAVVDQGQLPARKFPAGELPAGAEIVDPNTGRWEVHRDGKIADTGTFWACGYCSHRDRCAETASGRQEIPVTLGGAA